MNDPGESAGRRGDPWWLQPGVETCPHCLIRAHSQALYRCHVCDDDVCLACVVTVVERRVALCPACARERDRS